MTARPRPTSLNVRNIPDETRRRLATAKSAQGLKYAEYLERVEHLHRLVEQKAREKPVGAVILFARALLEAAGLRYDL